MKPGDAAAGGQETAWPGAPRVLLLVPARTYRAADFLTAAARLGLDLVIGSDGALPLGGLPVVHADPRDLSRGAGRLVATVGPVGAVVAADAPMLVLAAAVASVALRMLDGGSGAGERAGPSGVIPQLRWLHEMERVCPLGGWPPALAGRAPPPDFDLPGLADWPGMRVGHRLRALGRHPLSMDLARNQVAAWTALLGEDDQRGFTEDLATVSVGLDHRSRLRRAAGVMDVTAWLEVVLSWPRRFVAGGAGWAAGTDGDRPAAGAG